MSSRWLLVPALLLGLVLVPPAPVAADEAPAPRAKADEKIKKAIADAREFQQPDGGFSTNYFQRSSSSPDIGLRINTTGHVLEFICLAATDEELRQPWVTRAVDYLCELFEETADIPVECGGLYHAVHGLMLYRMRRYAGK